MKKIIRCIIILFIMYAHTSLCAQETVRSFLTTTATLYESGAYSRSLESSKNAIHSVLKDSMNFDSLDVAKLYFYKGASEYYLKRFDASINSYNNGIQFCSSSDAGINYKAELLYERAFSQFELGDYLNAYESSKEAALVMHTVAKPNYDYLLSIYCDIAGSAATLGFQEEANNYLNKAKKLYSVHQKEIPTNTGEASKPVLFIYKAIEIINNKTSLNTADIIQIQQHVLDLEKLQTKNSFNVVEKRMYAVSLNFLGDAYLRCETSSASDYNKALSAIHKAINIIPRKFKENHYPQFQFNKIKAYKLQKKYDKALRLMNSLLGQLPKNDERLSYFQAEKATILLAQNNKQKALTALQQSIAYIHNDTTSLYKNFSNFKPSYDINETGLLVEMADIITKKYPKDSIVLSFASNMYKLGLIQFENCYREETFNNKLSTYYQTAIGGILKLKQLGYGYQNFNLENLLNRMETIENRLVWKQFQQSRFLHESTISDSILNKEVIIRKALVAARKRKDTAAIFEYTTQLKQHIFTLKREFPNIVTFAYDTFDVKKTQERLSDTKAILKYKKIGDQFYAFKITHNSIDFYEIDNKNKELQTSIETFYNQLSNRHKDKILAAILYNKLLPFRDQNITEYTIIPDNILHYIPFETLVTSNTKYLIEEVAINYASHLVFVNHISESNSTIKNDEIIVFTPKYDTELTNNKELALRDEKFRLLGAEKESQLLSTIFPSTLFESILATKDNFIKHSPKAKIIHLAMHANINNETPELTHLLFNESNDSKLYIEELYGLNLNADLAVLSACNTGKGSIDSSKGMVSLNRAFTLAGVPSTLASLWEVPDNITQKIMVDFYQNLKNGQSKTLALRNAKINYLKNTNDINFQMPFYWAGFVLHGDSTPITIHKSCTPFIIVMFLLVAFIIAIIVVRRIKTNTLKLF